MTDFSEALAAVQTVNVSMNRYGPCRRRGRFGGICSVHEDCREKRAAEAARAAAEMLTRGEPVRPKSRRRGCGCAS